MRRQALSSTTAARNLHSGPPTRTPWLSSTSTHRPLHDAVDLFPLAQSANANADRRPIMPFFLGIRPSFPPPPPMPEIAYAPPTTTRGEYTSPTPRSEVSYGPTRTLPPKFVEDAKPKMPSASLAGRSTAPELTSRSLVRMLADCESETSARREAVELYMALRTRSVLLDLPADSRLRLLRLSTLDDLPSTSSTSITDTIKQDLLDCLSSRRRRDDTPSLIHGVFELAATGTISLSNSHAISLFYSLPDPEDVQQYTPTMICRVFEAMLNVEDEAGFVAHLPFLTTFTKFLAEALVRDSRLPRKRGVWAIFRFMDRLSSSGTQTQTGITPRMTSSTSTAALLQGTLLEVFAVISDAGLVPQGIAGTAVGAMSASMAEEVVRIAVLDALVSSCLRWGWHRQAMKLLDRVVPSAESTFEGIRAQGRPGRRKLYTIIPSERRSALTERESEFVRGLIRRLLASPNSADYAAASALLALEGVEDEGLVKTSFARAEGRFVKDAAAVYAHLRALKNNTNSTLDLLPPRGVLPDLLNAYMHLRAPDNARDLVRDILEHDRDRRAAASSSVVLDVDLVQAMMAVGDVELVKEIWARAEARWDGYSVRAICGNRVVLDALVRRFGEKEEFVKGALERFREVVLVGGREKEKDVRFWNGVCEAFGLDRWDAGSSSALSPSSSSLPSPSSPPPRRKGTSLQSAEEQWVDLLDPSRRLADRKPIARTVLNHLRETGSGAGSVHLRTLVADVLLETCWSGDVWDVLLEGGGPDGNAELRRNVADAIWTKWPKGRVPLHIERDVLSRVRWEYVRRPEWRKRLRNVKGIAW